MAYIMNSDILSKMGKYWRQCAHTTLPEAHSDTEIGRCVYKHTGKSCSGRPTHFKQVYHSLTERGQIVSRSFHVPVTDAGGSVAAATFNKQMVLKFQQTPFSSHLKAAFLHSLKTSDDFDRFHKQVMLGLRPPQPRLHHSYQEAVAKVAAGMNTKEDVLEVYRGVVTEMKKSCTNNPTVQRHDFGVKIKPSECPQPLWKEEKGMPKVYIRDWRTLPTTIVVTPKPASIDERARLKNMLHQLAQFGIDSVEILEVDTSFSRSPPSDFAAQEALAMADGYYVRGMVAPLEALLNKASKININNVHVNSNSTGNSMGVFNQRAEDVDDGGGVDGTTINGGTNGGGGGGVGDSGDAGTPESLFMVVHASDVLHCNFVAQYKKFMAAPRCGGHLRTQRAGGVLYVPVEFP